LKSIAPRLRHRVTVQSFTTSQDESTGAITDAWTDLATSVPAEVYPLSGREFIAAQSLQAGVTTKITIRFDDRIDPKMRIAHDGTLYAIKAVLPDPTLRKHITLMCEAGVQ
jgi:SPP1 family predicted phage head-tail adaptor